MYYETPGLVIRAVDYSEHSKMLTILTPERGRISAAARGVKRIKSRMITASQPMCYANYVLFFSKGRYTLYKAEVIETFFGLRENLYKLALAHYFLEVLNSIAFEQEEREMLRLALNSLFALSKKDLPVELVKAVFEMKLMDVCGMKPDITPCGCGERDIFLDVRNGIIKCKKCIQPSFDKNSREYGIKMPLTRGIYEAMEYILKSDITKAFSFSLSEESMKGLDRIAESYVLVQLERGFKSLDFYHTLR